MSDEATTVPRKPATSGTREYIVIVRHSPWRLKQATITARDEDDAKRQFREKVKAVHEAKAVSLATRGTSNSTVQDDLVEAPANPIKAMKVADACRGEYEEGFRQDKAGIMHWQIEIKADYEARQRTLAEKQELLLKGMDKLLLNQLAETA